MKRSLLILLIICTVLSCVSCGGRLVAPPQEAPTTDEKPGDHFDFTPPDDNPKSDIAGVAWTDHAYVKTAANGEAPPYATLTYRVYMAKAETEGCQIVFKPEADVTSLALRCVHQYSASLEYKIYSLDTTYEMNGEILPDPASEYTEGRRFSVEAGRALPFLVEFETTSETKAGFYPFVFELRDASERTVAQYSLIVRVWDITIPEKKSYQSSIGITAKDITTFFFGHKTNMTEEVYVNYYELLLDHNLSALDLPYDILDERADAYMSDPRVTAFRVPHDVSDETLKEYYKKLSSDNKWLKKAYFMPMLEPDSIEEIEDFCYAAMRLQEICPKIRITAPISKDVQIDPIGWDQINQMKGYCTLWAPKLCLWDDEVSYGDHDYVHSMSFEARMRKMMSENFGVWTYLNHRPGEPYISLGAHVDGHKQRILFWQQYQRGIHGLVYTSSTAWNTTKKVNPWTTLDTGLRDSNLKPAYGEGVLFYPGNKITDAPTVSLRMKIMRDGIDDIELFMLAAKTLGNKWVNDRINSSTSILTYVDADAHMLMQLRIEIGNALEKALP